MCSLDAENRSDPIGVSLSVFDEFVQVHSCPNDDKLTTRGVGHLIEASCLVKRTLFEALPCGRWPALGDSQPGNVIGIGGVSIQIQSLGDLGDHGENLQGDIGLLQAWEIDVSASRAVQQITAPEQAVGMQIDDGERLVQTKSGV